MYYRVMIVDDEAIILSGIKSLINWEENGCEVTATARNGKDALEQMRAFPPDIVLADINMPVMDGVTLMKKRRKNSPRLCSLS
ncbi:MAG TPA: response regulator [Candidatus Mediterraneibacter caccavium]|uniref:Stage 0 sporulation protein A homolog n=1 Tax=Candidatus Mediterraneibacter caccavium TaxID=2838661 RepID=A0A9D1VVI4_9FIRM|nr:response regulator [Candidatus Mediterraneibacter caccavium]